MEERMAEERRCKTCGLSSSNNVTVKLCRYFGETCNDYNYFSKWQPIAQEKPMENKVIFESEEQFVNFWKDLTGCDCLPGTREKIKQKGYIRKSAVEEAEEMYKEWLNRIGDMSETVVMDKMYFAIQELKSEIERLKK
jgi:hypothetical protein